MINSYIEPIKTASVFFPFIALIISLPFILSQYHRYGSISRSKALLTYTFILYMMCAYFLVILPLPSIDEVSSMTSPRLQLIPFSFVIDFINNYNPNIYKSGFFYIPIFNILLTMPFGMYLRYFFKKDFKDVIKYTFLLTLFFEITQLSGLYFIYPRGYRLCDVDDLIQNTLGGILGYIALTPFLKILPTKEEIDLSAYKRGEVVSGLRRSLSFFMNIVIFFIVSIIIGIFYEYKYTLYIVSSIYYIVIPFILKGSTLTEKFINLKVVDKNDKSNIVRLIYRRLVFILIYFGIPYVIIHYIGLLASYKVKLTILCIFAVSYILFLIVSIFKFMFTKKRMLYELISGTKLVSLINCNQIDTENNQECIECNQ